jgi:hypothetical protein
LTYSVHAASTVLACAFHNDCGRVGIFLDEIDASTLRLLSRAPAFASARRSARCLGPPAAMSAGRSTPGDGIRRRRQRLSADRWAPRSSRAAVRRPIQCGLVTTIARRT